MRKLIREVHRRSLWQVLGIYLAGSWVAYEVVQSLTEGLGLPSWFPGLAVVLLIIGLPIVVATAFVQEGLPSREEDAAQRPAIDGAVVEAEPAMPFAPARHERLLTWRNAVLGGVTAFALWGVVAAGWVLFGGRPAVARDTAEPTADHQASIAVLPFQTRSALEEDQYFAEGVHDDILTQLSHIASLKVISRTSVMQYAGTTKPIRQIGEELGASTVLEGGIQRSASRIRVNAQLIDAATDAHLWAETYDEEMTPETLFGIQGDIARAIADALKAKLTADDTVHIEERPTDSIEAWEYYVQAKFEARKGGVKDGLRAIELLRRAIGADSSFAEAYAALASRYIALTFRQVIPTAEALANARPAAERALALKPGLADAHVAHGLILERTANPGGAEREYRKAVELEPGSAGTHLALAGLYHDLNRLDEAREHYDQGLELDPLALPARANLAALEIFGRKWSEGERQARRVLELDPNFGFAHYLLASAYSFQARHEEAIAEAERAVALEPKDLANAILVGFVHARAGHRERALEIAGDVERRGGSLKEIALVHAALGDIDTAFEYLERSLERDPSDLATLMSDPSADPLRDDPRFDDLLRRAGYK